LEKDAKEYNYKRIGKKRIEEGRGETKGRWKQKKEESEEDWKKMKARMAHRDHVNNSPTFGALGNSGQGFVTHQQQMNKNEFKMHFFSESFGDDRFRFSDGFSRGIIED
jgi:hypothetical protein